MSDWWTPSSSTSYSTPSRGVIGGSSQRARFAGDELDPEDVKMAENMKFLPSFASSPAGKAILGSSPGGGNMGSGGASPPVSRRSPGTRFSMGESASSPRDSRRKTITQFADEDMPPTASLRDGGDTPTRSLPAGYSSNDLPPPPSLSPGANTTSLHIFGPPPSVLATLQPYLETFGPIKSFSPGPPGSNWYVVEFASPTSAAYALRRHGEIVNGRYMLGFKVAGPGSTMGCTLVDGVPPPRGAGPGAQGQNGEGGQVERWTNVAGASATGAGTPMVLRQGQVFATPKAAPIKTDDYSWEDQPSSGFGNRLAEWLFGR